MRSKIIFSVLLLFFVFQSSSYAGGQSTFKQMKEDVSRGGWEVIWSESYGYEKAALLAACVYFGCAQDYLGHELDSLKSKVGKQILEQALRNKGKVIFGPGNLEIQAGTAFWSTWYRVPITREKLTTARYVRLYVKYRRKTNSETPSITNKCKNVPNIEVRVGNNNKDFGKNKSWKTCTGYRTIFQNDGNFVVYNPSGRAVWASNTHGKGGKILALQADGNLVIYASGGKPIWASNTHGNPGSFLAIQQDGNVVIYNRKGKALWATGTNGR